MSIGIQPGQAAITSESKAVEQALRAYVNSDELQTTIALNGFTHQTRSFRPFSHEAGGLLPDGGIVLDALNKPIVSFEAKYQGRVGNAIERLAKNHLILSNLNPGRYNTIVLLGGSGFFDGNAPERIVRSLWESENLNRPTTECFNSGVGRGLILFRVRSVKDLPSIEKQFIDSAKSTLLRKRDTWF